MATDDATELDARIDRCLDRTAAIVADRPRWVRRDGAGGGVERAEVVDDAGAVRLVVDERNPLDESAGGAPPLAVDGASLVVWSGSLAGPFPEHLETPTPLNWMPPGGRALADWLDRLDEDARARRWIRPHARHVLSDPPSVRAWWRRRAEAAGGTPPVGGLALDLAALLEPSMLGDADEHLRLHLRNLGDLASVVMLADVRIDADRCRAVPPGEGALGPSAWEAMRAGLADFVAPGVPVVVLLPGTGEA